MKAISKIHLPTFCFLVFTFPKCSEAYFSSLLRTRNHSKVYCHLNVTPIHYQLQIDAAFLPEAITKGILLRNATASASVKIRFAIRKCDCDLASNVSVITLNPRYIEQIDLDHMRITHLGSGKQLQIINQTVQYLSWLCEKSHHKIEISDHHLENGDELEIFIPYQMDLRRNYLNDNWKGFYFINADEIHPTISYNALRTPIMFPAFDEDPSHKSTFKVIVTRPIDTNVFVISNMDLEKTTNISGRINWLADHFRQSVPLQTSQLAVVILHGFRKHTTVHVRNETSPDSNETSLNLWVNEKSCENNNNLDITGVYASRLLGFFEKKFGGWEYPVNKLDFIALPTTKATIWDHSTLGIVLNYESTILLQERTLAPPQAYQYLSQHIAFQWLGGMITIPGDTNPICGDATISERLLALSQFVATLAINEIPEFARDWSPYTIYEMPEVGHLAAFDLAFGRGVFESAVLEFYLPTMKWKTTDYGIDFYEAMEKAIEKHNATHLLPPLSSKSIGATFLEIFHKMINHSYYNPVVHVTYMTNSSTLISLTQENIIGKDYGATYIETWWIPIKILVDNEGEQIVWLPPTHSAEHTTSSVQINLLKPGAEKDKFIIVNPNGITAYVVKYEADILRKTIKRLNSNHSEISVKAKRFLLDNHFSLLRYTESWDNVLWEDLKMALDLTKFLQNETDWRIWFTALNHVENMWGYFEHKGMVQHVEVSEIFQAYVSSLMRVVLQKIGMIFEIGEDENTTLLRSILIEKCSKYGAPICSPFALQRLKESLTQTDEEPFPSSNFSEDAKKHLYCAAVARSWTEDNEQDHEELFHFLLDSIFKLENLTVASCGARKGIQILEALTCTKSESLLASLLNHTAVGVNIPNYLRKDYVNYLPQHIRARIPLRLDAKVADFWMEEAVQGRISPNTLIDYLWDFIWNKNMTEGIREKINEFYEQHKEMLKGEFVGERVARAMGAMAEKGIVSIDFQEPDTVPDEDVRKWFLDNTVK